MKLYPVVLCGGAGTRLWPLSREHYPKQFLALLNQQTLLQNTVSRLGRTLHAEAPLVVCNEVHRFLVNEQLRAIQIPAATILLEPQGRNTAPALTLAALWLHSQQAEPALMVVMPADHVIQDLALFQETVAQALPLAEAGQLVTFGVQPTCPETGYGYIQRGDGHRVKAFVEKPDFITAESYLAAGDYLWNSGIFVMRTDQWLQEMNIHVPAILSQCQLAFGKGQQDGPFYRVDSHDFAASPSQSIDYAVMEHTTHAAVLPLTAGWSDVGSWSVMLQVNAQDAAGNVLKGDVLTHFTENSFLESGSRLLAAVGLKDMIVVETADAVLVAHQDYAQEVKEIVNQLKAGNREEYQIHRRVSRPWGYYETVDRGERFQVKRITVHPGAALSLQMHHHRAEHWVVVKGTARVTRDTEISLLNENQSVYIPVGMKHRLENPGQLELEIIEVQSGSYLGEDDIVRFEDRYHRV